MSTETGTTSSHTEPQIIARYEFDDAEAVGEHLRAIEILGLACSLTGAREYTEFDYENGIVPKDAPSPWVLTVFANPPGMRHFRD